MDIIAENIPVFVVNLRRDTAKREYMLALCDAHNLSVEFIQAVDGRLLGDEEIRACYSKADVVKKFHRELSRSEIGCALSHKKVFKKIVDERINRALILEDDVVFDERLVELLAGIESFPKKWNIVLLGHHSDKGRNIETQYSFMGRKKFNKQYALTRPMECGCGTYGYIVKLDAAKILLRELEVIYKPVDHYTGIDQILNLYTVSPAVILPHDFLSDHCHSMHERNEMQKSIRCNKKKTIKRQILDMFHLYGIALKLRDSVVKVKHRITIPRNYE